MKPLVAIAATLLIAIIAIYFWSNRASSELDVGASGSRSGQRAITDGEHVSQQAPIMDGAEARREAIKTSARYREAYSKSRDLWTFAHELLPAARAGHADAQFYLSKAIDNCAHDNKMFFEHRGTTLNLEDGIKFAAQRHLSLDLAQRVYDRCHKFLELDATELGSPADWLAKSTDAGYSPAQAMTAEQLLFQGLLKNMADASGVPVPEGPPVVENRMSPRELLKAALTSEDPEVLFEIGDTHAMLNPTASAETEATERYAWWLVACQRGLDCGASADWIMSTCSVDPQCGSYTDPADYLRGLAGDHWSEVQQRAVEISQKLDAHQWSDLGLGL